MCLGVPYMSTISALIKLNLPLGRRHVCLLGILFINVVVNFFICLSENTLSLWMLLSMRTNPSFSLAIFKEESVSEESSCTFKFVEPTPCTVSDSDPHSIILPTNQVPWKTYYRKNLIKKIESLADHLASVQDSKPP